MIELGMSIDTLLVARSRMADLSLTLWDVVSAAGCSILRGFSLVQCRMIKLGLSIDEDEAVEATGEGEDLPPLEENVDEGSRMEEVD